MDRTYPEEFGSAVEGYKTPGGAQAGQQYMMPEGLRTGPVDDQKAIDFLAHVRSAMAEVGPEFAEIPDNVLGRWLRQYLRKDFDFGMDQPSPRGMPWDPANRRIQGGINQAGF